jgi:uncharacterized SAM-binding protein YcdF (DUF218 family)
MYPLMVQLLEPYTLLLMSSTVATACAWRGQRPRSRPLKTATALLGLLALLSTPLAGYLAQGSLEWSYPPTSEIPAAADTIVVLAGGLVVDDDAGTQVRLSDSTLQRCVAARRLYRRAGGCRLVLCGGKVDWSTPGPTLAVAMRDFLTEAGARPDDLVLEEKSSTTYENALFSKALLNSAGREGARIWLVTEATHMRRAMGCFRTLGIECTPAPCDHHAWREEFSILSVIPCARGVSRVAQAAHEWMGLFWYRLRGRA